MNSFKRKASRKFTKYSNILLSDYGIKAVQYPTKNLMLCNAGLQLCVPIEDIFSCCSQFGEIEKVNMLPGKSYSFISFEEVRCAEQLYNNVNGRSVLKSLKGPLYLLFTEEVPEVSEKIVETFSQLPPGAIIIENFVNEMEEAELMSKFGILNYTEGNFLKHRQVKHYGFEFMYSNNNVDKKNTLEDLPAEVVFLNNRLVEVGFSEEFVRWKPDQLTVNVYIPGQGIPPHVDTHSAFEDPILSLSLNASVVMDFQKIGSEDLYSVLLPRRSLLIISKESRYCWTHGITPRKNDVILDPKIGITVMQRRLRCSLTFRKVRWKKCDCEFSECCDSQKTFATS